ncbi:MAG: hypothetical protein ABI682_12835 [Acidobacteriota bacterium]
MTENQKALTRAGFLLAVATAASGCASHLPAPAPSAVPAAEAPARTIPLEALAGYWLFEMKTGGRTIEGSLHFQVEKGMLVGTFTGHDGNERELSNLTLKADAVAWDFEGAAGRQHADGKIDGSSMKGRMKRAARSRNGGETPGTGDTADTPDPQDRPRGSGESGGGGRGGGGRRGGGGGRGGRRGSGGGSRAVDVTWSAYRSALAPAESVTPATPGPTPGA